MAKKKDTGTAKKDLLIAIAAQVDEILTLQRSINEMMKKNLEYEKAIFATEEKTTAINKKTRKK
jgi:hypothetical protein